MTMLTFVIPLRDPGTTPDWPGVCRLLERTLASACGQLDPGYRVVVVGHVRPEGIVLPPRCEFVPVKFPPPQPEPHGDEARRMRQMRTDKGRKLLHGLAIARAEPGSHVMFLDADDLVSNRLAGFVAGHPGGCGWYVDRGYRLDEYPQPALYWRHGFYKECGSSYLIRTDVAPFPDRLDDTRDYADYHVRRYVVHAHVRNDLARRGTPLAPLPFYGAVYTFNRRNMFAATHRAPDSRFRAWLRRTFKECRLTPALQKEFGIVPVRETAGNATELPAEGGGA